MHSLIRRVDSILVRVPSDSVHGRKTRDELLQHFEASVEERMSDGQPFASALEGATTDFGNADTLESDYYDDYLRARYGLFGLIDREEWSLPRACARIGLVCATLGLVFGWLIPTIGAFASAFGIARISVNDPSALDSEALREASDLAIHAPFPSTMTLLTGYGLPSPPPIGAALGVLGFVLLIAATILTLRRVHSDLTSHATPLGLVIAGLGAIFVWSSTSVGAYADAIFEIVYTSDDARLADAGDALSLVGLAGLGLLVLAAAALAIVLLRARRQGLARTILLRQLVSAAAMSTLGIVLASHRGLAASVRRLADDPDSVSPAQLVGTIDGDLAKFVLGGLLVLFGVLRFERCLERALRIDVARAPSSH